MSSFLRGAIRSGPKLSALLPPILAVLVCCTLVAVPSTADDSASDTAADTATDSATDSAAEPTFDDFMARELELQTDRPFVAPNDLFRVLLPFPLAGEPTLLEEDEQVSFSLDLGTEAPVNCFAHYKGLDPAASVATVSELSLPVGAEGSAILGRQIQDIDLFLVERSAVVAADWLYDVEQDGQRVTGMLKLRAADVGQGGVLCVHDEVGYSETLDGVMERLVRTWREPTEPANQPLFQEIHRIRVNGQPVGIETLSISVDQDGDYVLETKSFDLLPVDAQSLTGEDTYAIDYAFADGVLINSLFVVSNGGELSHHLNLSPEDETKWTVSGTFESKQIDETFEHGAMTSELLDRAEIREFLASASIGDKLVQDAWLADVSPAAITQLPLEYLGREGKVHRVRLTLGELTMDAEADDQGALLRGQAKVADVLVEMERIFVDGVFPRVSRNE